MFKNMFKRAWLSIKRKFSRTFILAVILFVMANLLLATIAIKNSVQKSTGYAKEKIGGVVYLQADTQAIREQMREARESGETPKLTIPTISEEMVTKIADSTYVNNYTYSVVANANASSFTIVETAQNTRERQFQNALNDAQSQAEEQVEDFNEQRDAFNSEQQAESQAQQQGPGGSGERPTPPNFSFDFNLNFTDPELARGDTQIQGISDFSYISNAESGEMKLIEGAVFNSDSNNEVVISTEVADENNLSVGSEIKLKRTADDVEVTFNVVGIYQDTTEDFNYNTIYTTIAGAKSTLTEAQASELSVQNVRYYLASAEDKDAFLAETAQKYPNLAEDKYILDVDDEAYQQMVGPIEYVGSFAGTVQWIVLGATLVIITLIIVINVKDRRYEMGVLLSLGARRLNIVGQIFIELIVIGTIGFALSLGTSKMIAQKMGDNVLKQQIATETAAEEETETDGPPRGLFNQSNNLSGKDVTTINTIDVSAGTKEYATLFALGYLMMLLAMFAPSVNILRYQPKEILSGKE